MLAYASLPDWAQGLPEGTKLTELGGEPSHSSDLVPDIEGKVTELATEILDDVIMSPEDAEAVERCFVPEEEEMQDQQMETGEDEEMVQQMVLGGE